MEELDKKYYKIKDVADFVGVTQSTLRFWEKEFPEISPMRSPKGIRYYTPKDIETLRIIYFLLREKGMKIEAAKYQISVNRKNLSKRLEIIENLENIRDDLQNLLASLNKR